MKKELINGQYVKRLSLEQILHSLELYKYLVLFPLCVVEGPIIAIIAGFLCANGMLNPLIAFPVIVAGDITGDSICYAAGRFAAPRFGRTVARWIGVTEEKKARVKAMFNENPIKTISLSKIILGIGVAGIFLAGRARVPYLTFIRICLVTSAGEYIIYLTVGALFGSAYRQTNHYLNIYAGFTFVAAAILILFLFIQSKRKKI